MHSSCSDGRLSPREVVSEARAAGLDCISLTDHDTLAGVPEAQAEAGRVTGGPTVVWGCEVTTSFEAREVHVLAYFREQPDSVFEEFLSVGRAARRHRIDVGVRSLRKEHGIEIYLAEIEELAGGAVLSRAHVAQALVDRKVVPDRKRAFSRLLGDEQGIFPPTELTPRAACEAIHASAGFAVWAHPASDSFAPTLEHLVASGIDGVEVITRRAGHNARANEAATANDLLLSGGSDWHGYGVPPSRGRWHVPSVQINRLLERLGVS